MISRIRQHLAKRRLARMVESNKRAPATLSYVRHREAALKYTRGRH